MQILQHTISTKAGETQNLRWLVVQSRPYPRINGECGRLKWENTEGLFDRYQHPATGLGKTYIAYLLAPDANPGEDYNRTDFAGHVDYNTRAVKPGAIRFRGQDLGETNLTLDTASKGFPTIRIIDGSTAPSANVRKLFDDQILPGLWQFIAEHANELREEAIAAVRKKFNAEILEKRNELEKLQAEIAKAKF